MEKFLLQIELRYNLIPKGEYRTDSDYTMVTIGVYETFQEAINEGNKVVREIVAKYGLKIYSEFGEHNGAYRSATTLVTNACSNDRVKYFAKITKLQYLDLDEQISIALKSQEKYDNWNKYNK